MNIQLNWAELYPGWEAMNNPNTIVPTLFASFLLAYIVAGMIKNKNFSGLAFFALSSSMFLFSLFEIDKYPFEVLNAAFFTAVTITGALFAPIGLLMSKNKL